MTKLSPKFFGLAVLIAALTFLTFGCPAIETSNDESSTVGENSPSFAEASDSYDRPFREEFLSVDLGISRDVIEREDALGPPSVTEASRAIYVVTDDVGDKTINELIDEAISDGGTYLMTYWAQGQLRQISREWYQGSEDGFSNSEHRSLVTGFAGLEEQVLPEDDSRVVGYQNALRDALHTDGRMGELSSEGVSDLLGDWDLMTAVGGPGEDINEFLYFEEAPGMDLTGTLAGDAITQLASEGIRSTLTVRVKDNKVIGSLIGHVIGSSVELSGSETGVVYSRFFWSKADVISNRD